MSQFGGAPRDQDYGFFTTPARTAVSTSQFGSTAVETRPAHAARQHRRASGPGVRTARTGTPREPGAFPQPPRPAPGAAAGGRAARWGCRRLPERAHPWPEPVRVRGPAVVTQPLAPYVVAAPDQLLGWERSSGPEAQQIDAMFRDSGAFPADAVTTFLYVTGRGKPALYGAVVVQHLSRAEQRDNLANTTRGMRQASPDTLGAFTERPAGRPRRLLPVRDPAHPARKHHVRLHDQRDLRRPHGARPDGQARGRRRANSARSHHHPPLAHCHETEPIP